MRKFTFLLSFFVTLNCYSTILPENNLAIPVTDKNEGLNETQYNQVIDKVEAVYRPIIEKLGGKLTIRRLWEDPRVNAGTTKKGNEIILNMYGGYARHPALTQDGYALVMCHELGHHLGGAPKKIEAAWATTEGQADYFATLKCLRKVFRHDDNLNIISMVEVNPFIKENCTTPFKEAWEAALCMRTTLAGISVSKISADIRRTDMPEVETPDENLVESTYDAHPVPQCRLDTYFQGSICEVSSAKKLSAIDETRGTCHPAKGHTSGLRPSCWFKPNLNARKPLSYRPQSVHGP